MLVQKTVSSPVGPLRLVADDDALVGLYFEGHHPAPRYEGREVASHPILDRAASELAAWFAAERKSFDVPLRLDPTDFQGAVWQALRAIPYGEQISYARLAQSIGRPDAVRAVAGAVALNPLSIFVPCHRVIGKHGDLTGYAGGLAAKRWLLDHERGVLPGLV